MKKIISAFKNFFQKVNSGYGGESTIESITKIINNHSLRKQSLLSTEVKIIKNLLNCYKLEIDDIKIPRSKIKAIGLNSTLSEIKDFFSLYPHTRVPVYKKDLDNIIGYINSREVLCDFAKTKKIKLEKYIRKILVVSPSVKTLDLLNEMQKTRTHIAVIVDEYGGIDGLVTLEDILESLVGNIEDEKDKVGDHGYKIIDDGNIEVSPTISLRQAGELCGVEFLNNDSDSDTIGGFILSVLGHVPKKGETVKHDGNIMFKILDADSRKIKKILIIK